MSYEHGKRIALVALIPLFIVGLSVYSFAEASPSKIAVLSPDQLKTSDDSPKIPPGLYKRIIAYTISPEDISDFEKKGCQVVHNLNDATALKCPTSVIPSLNNVREDRLFKMHDQVRGNFPIDADDVFEPVNGYDGSGIKVAILDTGVDASNQELSDSVIKTKNFIKGLPPHDYDGHGTHVSGIVTGNGIATITHDFEFVSPNWAKGSAPNADIIVGKVCWTLGCYESSIAKGIEWAVAQNADVLSMSLGSNEVFSGSCNGDFLAQKANWAVDQGLVVVVSSGNDGSSTGMSSPACGDQVISVGATDTTDLPYTVAAFSNSHTDGLTLVAPGVDILSTYSCRAAGDCTNNWYAWISGTSMSAPRVAGVAALVLDANPNLTPGQVKTALCVGAIEITDGLRDGCGMVNALAAVNSVSVPPGQDIEAPVINAPTISNLFVQTTSDQYVESNCFVTDNDPNYAGTCSYTGGIDTTLLGFYSVTFTAPADEQGNVPLPVTVSTEIVEPQASDAIKITKAEYRIRNGDLRVHATSDSLDPLDTTLTVIGYGEMKNNGDGTYQLRVRGAEDPLGSITVDSSAGGKAIAQVIYR